MFFKNIGNWFKRHRERDEAEAPGTDSPGSADGQFQTDVDGIRENNVPDSSEDMADPPAGVKKSTKNMKGASEHDVNLLKPDVKRDDKQSEEDKAGNPGFNLSGKDASQFKTNEQGVLREYNGTSEEVFIPQGMRGIAMAAFCAGNLKTVDIPGTVESIGKNAFKGCENLETVILHDGLSSIRDKCLL